MAEPKWLQDLRAALPGAVQRILDEEPPPCHHRYCRRIGYGLCVGVHGAQVDMMEDAREPYEPSGLDEFAPETTRNPSPLPALSLFEEEE